MYKALHLQTGEEIIILHPAWKGRISELRAMDHADLLVCQGCMQPLRVKAGTYKRAHFAHKHLQACSYGTESPAILNARAVLYEWLVEQFGLDVTVEKQLESSAAAFGGLPRPVDCWVETERGIFAYWIIEAGIKLEPREAILSAFDHLPVHFHPVFLSAMLNEEKKEFHSVLLTPTERAFLRRTAFDNLSLPARISDSDALCGTLHYLDADSETLTTYRGLSLYHRPNWFHGSKKVSPLSALNASPQNGELIHPGELDRLSAFHEKQQRLEIKRQRYERAHPVPTGSHPTWTPTAVSDSPSLQSGEGAEGVRFEPLPCAICGQVTTEYWSTFFDARGRKLCRCRECLERLK